MCFLQEVAFCIVLVTTVEVLVHLYNESILTEFVTTGVKLTLTSVTGSEIQVNSA